MKKERKQFAVENVWEQVHSLSDDFCLFRMDRITDLARKSLPEGFWGDDPLSAGGQPRLYLTFDDGPDPHTTPWLLDMLEESGAQATFFLIGANIAGHEHLVEKIARAGHTIGNHSFNHFLMPVLPAKTLETEIDRTNRLLNDITGSTPDIFRPPYGMIDQRAADCLRERNMRPVYWGVVPEDWSAPGAERVVSRVLRRLGHGCLVVLHEHRLLRTQTLKAAKQIICKGRELGYAFAPVT